MKINIEKLRALMQLRGLNQTALADRVGVSRQAVNTWLTQSRNIGPPNLEKLAKALHCKISDFAEFPELMQVALNGDKFAGAILGMDNKPAGHSPGEKQKEVPPKVPDTIRNTPELLLCIKDAMMRQGLTSTADLKRHIGYDSIHSLDRLLAGKLNWFPDVLSCVLDHLGISHDDAPITPTERELLAPEGAFKEGGNLVRPVPVVDWANAASYIGGLIGGSNSLQKYWDPENTKTVPAPMGTRKGTMAFRIYGESMEPKLVDGDNVLCRQVTNIQEIPNGKIVIVKFSESYHKCPDCVVCKRFRKIRDIICLTSDNSADDCRNFDDVTPQDIVWIGVVTGKYNDDF